MPQPQQRDMHAAWTRLNRAVGINYRNALKLIYSERHKMWKLVK
jgi:hypothetical protein